MRFAFIANHRHIWPVGWLCEVLEVSRSGFHAWLTRPLSDRAILDAQLVAAIDTSFSAMESFFSSRKTERANREVCRTRDEARADVFDDIERCCNPRRRHSKLGDLSPMEFEARAMPACPPVHETGSRPDRRDLSDGAPHGLEPAVEKGGAATSAGA